MCCWSSNFLSHKMVTLFCLYTFLVVLDIFSKFFKFTKAGIIGERISVKKSYIMKNFAVQGQALMPQYLRFQRLEVIGSGEVTWGCWEVCTNQAPVSAQITLLAAASEPFPCSDLGDALGKKEEKGRESLFIWPIFKHSCVTLMLELFKSDDWIFHTQLRLS